MPARPSDLLKAREGRRHPLPEKRSFWHKWMGARTTATAGKRRLSFHDPYDHAEFMQSDQIHVLPALPRKPAALARRASSIRPRGLPKQLELGPWARFVRRIRRLLRVASTTPHIKSTDFSDSSFTLHVLSSSADSLATMLTLRNEVALLKADGPAAAHDSLSVVRDDENPFHEVVDLPPGPADAAHMAIQTAPLDAAFADAQKKPSPKCTVDQRSIDFYATVRFFKDREQGLCL